MSLSVFRKSSDLYSVNGAMNRTNGFTLIEVLIAVLVLAVGLLGLAGLQVTSLGNSQSAYNRSVATQLAYDLADRMRANVAAVKAPAGNAYLGAAAQVTSCTTAPGGCGTEDMARNDLYEWNQEVAASLPSGIGALTVVTSPPAPDVFTVTITWNDDKSGANQSFAVSFQL